MLLAHLPRESWTARATGGDKVRWGDQEHLLATAVDTISQLVWMYHSVHAKKGTRLPPFAPLVRPGVPGPTVQIGSGKRLFTPTEIDRIRARMTPKAVSDGR